MLKLKPVLRSILPSVALSALLLVSMAGTVSANDPNLDKPVTSIEKYSQVHSEDDALVAFIQGDNRQPYVIGSSWSDDESPPPTKTEDSDE